MMNMFVNVLWTDSDMFVSAASLQLQRNMEGAFMKPEHMLRPQTKGTPDEFNMGRCPTHPTAKSLNSYLISQKGGDKGWPAGGTVEQVNGPVPASECRDVR